MEDGVIYSDTVANMLGLSCTAGSHMLERLFRHNWLERKRINTNGKYEYRPSNLLLEKYDTYMELPDD